jgi:hypothetical protein
MADIFQYLDSNALLLDFYSVNEKILAIRDSAERFDQLRAVL